MEAEAGQDVPDLLGDVRQIGLEHLGGPGELGPQLRTLRRNPHRTRIEVARANHDAALGQQCRGPKAVLVRAEERGDHHVATGLDPTIDAQADAPAQLVPAQRLLGFRQPDLPWHAGILDGRQGAGSRAAIRPRDVHHVGQALDHAGGDRSDTGLGDQLDRDCGQRIDLLEVVDQLREVFDGIDVVMWRRGDQGDPRLGVPEAGDLVGRLVTG